jgi:general secretion pathway protein G
MLDRLRKSSDEDGFTLIELLIVIVILGILAAIVVFAIGGTRKDSVASSCKTNFKSVELSAEAVYTKGGKYGPEADLIDSTKGGLLKVYPVSDDYKLVYAVTGSGTGYTLTVQKPGATAGTFSTVSADATNVKGCENL